MLGSGDLGMFHGAVPGKNCDVGNPRLVQPLLSGERLPEDFGQFPAGTAAAAAGVMDRRELEKRTADLAAAVFALTNAVRARPGGRSPADQLLDCATSVGANYRASARARSRAEFIAKLGVVNEEADEVVYWLEFFRSTNLADASLVEPLLVEAKELRSIFAASWRTAKHNYRGKRT